MGSRFSKKDYVVASDMVRDHVPDPDQRSALVLAFAEMFAADNPQFDWDRFTEACWRES